MPETILSILVKLMLSFEVSVIDVVLAMAIVIILLLQVKNAPNESATESKLTREKQESTGELSSGLTAWKPSERTESTAGTTEGSADCPYHFGYLKTLPLGSSVPERCYECSRVRECLVSH